MSHTRLSRLSVRLAIVLLALAARSALRAEPETAAAATHSTEPLSHAAPAAPTAPAHAESAEPAHEPPAETSAAPVHEAALSTEEKPAAHHAAEETAPASTSHAVVPAPAKTGARAPAKSAHGAPAPESAPPPGSEIPSMLKLGAQLTERADYDAAEIAFRQVLRTRGVAPADTKSALLGLARMHRKQGALTKAAAIYETFLKEYPEDERTPDALLELGRTIRALGTYNLAITRFYSVINSTLKVPGEGFEHYQLLAKTAQFEIAETYFQSGNFIEAAKFFNRLRLLDLAPADRARAHFKAAYSQHLQGQHEAALLTLRAFLEQSPDDENVPEARYLLAVTLRQLNRPQEAFAVTLELLRTAQATVSTNPKLWAYWQRRTGNQLANDFFAAGNFLNAQAIYNSLAELSPDPAWRLPILYQTALCMERLGDIDRAVITYRGIISAAGDSPSGDIAELVRMANWKLSQLDWTAQTQRKVASLFETTTGRAPPAAPSPVASKTTALP